jgi:hypothetical protein
MASGSRAMNVGVNQRGNTASASESIPSLRARAYMAAAVRPNARRDEAIDPVNVRCLGRTDVSVSIPSGPVPAFGDSDPPWLALPKHTVRQSVVDRCR